MFVNKKNSVSALNPYAVLILGTVGVPTGSIFACLADAPALVTAAYRVGLVALNLIPPCRLDFFAGLYGERQQSGAG